MPCHVIACKSSGGGFVHCSSYEMVHGTFFWGEALETQCGLYLVPRISFRLKALRGHSVGCYFALRSLRKDVTVRFFKYVVAGPHGSGSEVV